MIGNISITNPEAFAEYGKRVPDTVAQYGGTYLVRGGTPEKMEGEYDPVRIVVLQFESVERAKAWYNSTEYAPLKEMRLKASTGDLYFVEGV
ncbi:hypothetical protein GBAR_LOCUS4444 [Geodia barretti]|uniref:DUF1330 domain-containing protein n=1 Tax=Geodia barretti TaxID=519541 RepID=A0AA35R6P5_GEOBA|nr:hypothetical protein GBAR_LOCUS4444 [Geodia barretti]